MAIRRPPGVEKKITTDPDLAVLHKLCALTTVDTLANRSQRTQSNYADPLFYRLTQRSDFVGF